jgi:methionine salvage enolase-phosphatase E1
LQLFAGHFDTGVGPKVDSSSYRNIVEKLDCKSEDIVFLTDVPRGKFLKCSNFILQLHEDLPSPLRSFA